MSTMDYIAFGLAPWIDFQGTGEKWCEDQPIVFNVILKAEKGKVVLEYDLPGAPGQDYIAITANATVQINLLGDQLWFSKEFAGITTKEPLSSFYGDIAYGDYNSEYDRYKSLSFKARFNQGGKYGTCHRFNINVDLLQKRRKGQPQWIGLSIDPDIKNPPPQV